MPILATLAAIAALADMVLDRIAIRVLSESLSPQALTEMSLWSGLPRNLTVIAGSMALVTQTFTMMRGRWQIATGLRLGIAASSGVFIAAQVLLTLSPSERLAPPVVLLSTVVGALLASLCLAAAAQPGTSRRSLALLVVVGMATACPLLAWAVSAAGSWLGMPGLTRQWLRILRLGELAYLAAPLAFAALIFRPKADERWQTMAGIAAVVSAGIGGALIYAWRETDSSFAVLLYGAQHVEMWIENASAAYIAPCALAFGVATAGIVAKHPQTRWLGIAALLLACAGYAPRAPAPMVAAVLAATLLARTVRHNRT